MCPAKKTNIQKEPYGRILLCFSTSQNINSAFDEMFKKLKDRIFFLSYNCTTQHRK